MPDYTFTSIVDRKIAPIDSLTVGSGGNTYTWAPLEEGSSYAWSNIYQGSAQNARLTACRLEIVAMIWQNNFADLVPHLVYIEQHGLDSGSILLKPIAGQQGAGEMEIGVPDPDTLVKSWKLQWGIASGDHWGKMQITLTAYYSKDVLESPSFDVFHQISGWG